MLYSIKVYGNKEAIERNEEKFKEKIVGSIYNKLTENLKENIESMVEINHIKWKEDLPHGNYDGEYIFDLKDIFSDKTL